MVSMRASMVAGVVKRAMLSVDWTDRVRKEWD
jgi:hypothetical protein